MQSVLVLCGGTSSEREISLRSGKAVMNALTQSGFSVSSYDPAENLDYMLTLASQSDVVFPVLHGEGGEDGKLQAILESHNIPYIGTNSQASALCFDKNTYRDFLISHGFALPNGCLVDKESFIHHKLTKKPFVLKPNNGGSSIDTFIVRDPNLIDLPSIDAAFSRHGTLLMEELVIGTEITAGVLIDTALPLVEIVPPLNQEFDYVNKYNGATRECCPPETISENIQKEAQELAKAIHTVTNCKGFSRTDMIINEKSKIWVLETNTIPGLTDQSLFPKSARATGINMPKLVRLLVEDALR